MYEIPNKRGVGKEKVKYNTTRKKWYILCNLP